MWCSRYKLNDFIVFSYGNCAACAARKSVSEMRKIDENYVVVRVFAHIYIEQHIICFSDSLVLLQREKEINDWNEHFVCVQNAIINWKLSDEPLKPSDKTTLTAAPIILINSMAQCLEQSVLISKHLFSMVVVGLVQIIIESQWNLNECFVLSTINH